MDWFSNVGTAPDDPDGARTHRSMMASARRNRFLASRGISKRATRDPHTRREADRRRYIRLKARRLGISESRAAEMTPRLPSRGRYGERERNARGEFVRRGGRSYAQQAARGEQPSRAGLRAAIEQHNARRALQFNVEGTPSARALRNRRAAIQRKQSEVREQR